MEILQIAGIGLIAAVLVMVLREQKPVFAFLLTLFTGILIILFLIGKIAEVIDMLRNVVERSGINVVFLQTMLKIIGIAYIAEFAAQITRDAGAESIASKIEMAGKILILFMAIPIITAIIETVLELLPVATR